MKWPSRLHYLKFCLTKSCLYPSSLVSENLRCHSRSCMSLGQRSMVLMYILTAESKSEYLHSLHRCRGLPRRSREAIWKQLGMRQSRRPDMRDGASRSPSQYCQRGLTQQCILTVGSQSASCSNISWILLLMPGKSQGYP